MSKIKVEIDVSIWEGVEYKKVKFESKEAFILYLRITPFDPTIKNIKFIT